MFKRISAILFILLYLMTARGQPPNCIDIGTLAGFDTLKYRIAYFSDFSGKTTINDVTAQPFSELGSPLFNERKLDGSHFFKFCLYNSSNAADTFWLYMGKAQKIKMFEVDEVRGTTLLHNKRQSYSPVLLNQVPYFEVVVPKGTRRSFIMEAKLTFYNWQQLDPVIVVPSERVEFEFEHLFKPSRFYIFTSLPLLGVMVTMFIFTILLFFSSGKWEYLYCAGAIFVFFLYFSLRMLNVFSFSNWYYFFYDFRYQVLQLLGNIFLLLFISTFLHLKTHYPRLHYFFKISVWAQLLFLVVNIPLTYINRFNYIGNITFDLVRVLLLLYSVFLIFVLISRRKEKEARYLAAGSLIAIALSALALVIDRWSQYDYLLIRNTGIPVLIFMSGVLLQSFLFLQALSYRNRRQEAARVLAVEQLQLENERKELEKYKAIIDARENERNRISQEIHDDIGSGLTSIRLLSEIAKAKSNQSDRKELDKISSTSSSLMDKMNEIIWTLNSRNDTLPNLLAYLRHLVVEYFEPLQVRLHVSMPEQVKEIAITGKIRRNILLCVKEALHNIAKHSKATEVKVNFAATDRLSIHISDNGIGFKESDLNHFSNGLFNMRDRIASIGGTCEISTHNGTSILMIVPLVNYPL